VPDIESAVSALQASGARVLGEVKTGAHGLPVVFLHPKDFDGTLIELEEVKPDLQPA
jgi:methylmalonyl-CoA/ethylmalonyl-CoA epimerase